MITAPISDLLLGICAVPSIYYALALVSSVKFFGTASVTAKNGPFQPPVSILKPVRGLDPDAYENFASFCTQDYPEYEILFCVGDSEDPEVALINQVISAFPQQKIRILFGSGRTAANDKVAKLVRLVEEAAYEYLVISDSDVRVEPDYLRRIVAPLADPKIGAVTCFYVPTKDTSWIQRLQDVGMLSDFYPGILVAKQLDGVKFALGPTIGTTRTRLQAFGGYAALENRPADDLLVGRLIAHQGYEVELLPYSISTVPDYQSLRDLFHKRLRCSPVKLSQARTKRVRASRAAWRPVIETGRLGNWDQLPIADQIVLPTPTDAPAREADQPDQEGQSVQHRDQEHFSPRAALPESPCANHSCLGRA